MHTLTPATPYSVVEILTTSLRKPDEGGVECLHWPLKPLTNCDVSLYFTPLAYGLTVNVYPRQGFQRSVLGKRGQILQRMWPSFCLPVADKMLVNQGLRQIGNLGNRPLGRQIFVDQQRSHPFGKVRS